MIQLGHDERGSYAILDMGAGDEDGLYMDCGMVPVLFRFVIIYNAGVIEDVVLQEVEHDLASHDDFAVYAQGIVNRCEWLLNQDHYTSAVLRRRKLEQAILDQIREERREDAMERAG